MDDNNRRNLKGDIVVKSGSDDMRAFYDFCIDFIMEEGINTPNLRDTDELLNWCKDPEIIKFALLYTKYMDKGKP